MPKAADYFQRALIHNQNANRQAQVAAAHANLGLVFEELGDVDQMCAHWRQAQLLYLDSGDGDQAAFYGVLLEQAACALR